MSKAQATTIKTIAANGGEMNGYAGQPGFYCNSIPALVRLGLLDRLGCCACFGGEPCDREHGDVPGKGGHVMYNRVRLTDAGRRAAEGLR